MNNIFKSEFSYHNNVDTNFESHHNNISFIYIEASDYSKEISFCSFWIDVYIDNLTFNI